MKDYTDELPGHACDLCGKIDDISVTGRCRECMGDPAQREFCMTCGTVLMPNEADQFDGVCVSCAEEAMARISSRVVDWYNKHTWNKGVAL